MGRSATDILAQHGIGLTEEELEHAGVKGMKWGRRKKERKAAAAEREADIAKIKTMSDDELKSKINRIKLEKEYKKLTSPEISEGRKIVGEILKDYGKQQAKAYLNANGEALLKGGLKKVLKSTVKAAAPAAARQVVTLAPKHMF